MVKRKSIILVLLSVLTLVSLVALAIPKPALAAPGEVTIMEWDWSGAFNDWGDVAYTENSTANLTVALFNEVGLDVTIKSAKVKFDWGSTVDALSFPSQLKNGEQGIAEFEITMPSTDVATNLMTHAYQISVVYEVQDGAAVVNNVGWEDLSLDPGNDLDNAPIVPDSETLYDVTATAVSKIAAGNYTLNDYTGVVAWVAPYAPSGTVHATYKYTEAVFTGDGLKKVGYLANAPVVAGSEIVCIKDTAAITIKTAADAGYSYTIDDDTGKITFATAPAGWQSVGVYYKYYRVATDGDANLAIVTSDQLAAQKAEVTADDVYDYAYDYLLAFEVDDGGLLGGISVNDWGDLVGGVFVGSGTTKALTAGDVAYDAADDLYDAGDFVGAKTKYDEAATQYQAAIDAQSALVGGVETGVTGLITGAGGWLDGQAAKADADAASTTALVEAQKAKLQGEADKASNYGIFLILMGVGGILVGLGGLLWGVSRVIGARKANQ